ncbi:hypothetical protein Drorol1_Dr00020422 [Drosera rotundifolia]
MNDDFEHAYGDDAEEDSRPTILVKNGDGIESPRLIRLVEGLVWEGRYRVYVCALHSLTMQEFVQVSWFEIEGGFATQHLNNHNSFDDPRAAAAASFSVGGGGNL